MIYKTLLLLCRFYSDSETWAVHKQFLWGAHLLITPVLDPVSEHTHAHTLLYDFLWAHADDLLWDKYEEDGTFFSLFSFPSPPFLSF